MSKQTTITIVDDIDGSADAATVAFMLDGRQYEIDLAEENTAKLREALAPFVAVARVTGRGRAVLRSVGGNARRTTARRDETAVNDTAAKRSFLREQGFSVGDRGRFSKEQEAAWAVECERIAADAAARRSGAAEPVAEPVVPPVRTKLGKLTAANVNTLAELDLLLDGSGQTFAFLEGDRETVLATVQAAMEAIEVKRGSAHYSSLVTLRKKLRDNNPKFVTVVGPDGAEIKAPELPAASSE